jgi:hypothetical protein
MSGYFAISAVGKSVERLLAAAFLEREPVFGKPTKVALARPEDFERATLKALIPDYGLALLLYRVDFNKTMRANWSATGHLEGRGMLALDLHYLVTPIAPNAEDQQMIIGRAMQVLEETPVLTGPTLYAPLLSTPAYDDEPRAAPTDSVQLLLEEISTEALMRIFDSMPGDYRLSVPYIARVVRLDTRLARPQPPVVDADIRVRMPVGSTP